MTEHEFEEFLAQAVEAFVVDVDAIEAFANGDEDREAELADVNVDTFEAAGVLTDNRGLLVRLGNAEFQVSIVRSR